MEYNLIIDEMSRVNKRLSNCMNEFYKLSIKKAETERTYRIKLQQTIFILRQEKYPATLIPDLARGMVASEKYERDLAEALYNSTRDSLRALMAELNSYQTMIKFQSELSTDEDNT